MLRRAPIEDWYSAAAKRLDDRQPLTVHLGDLFGDEWKSNEALSIGYQALVDLIAVVSHDAGSVMPGLLLPLKFASGARYGTELEPRPTGRDDVIKTISQDETPYIFVVPRVGLLALRAWHGYREPISGFFPWTGVGQIYSYYEVGRNDVAIRGGFTEFQRSIISEYYPHSLVPGPG